MIGKGLFTGPGHGIGCIGLSSDKSLVHFDKPVLFQTHQVGGQVAICNLQHLFEIVEANLLIDGQDAHHTEPDAVIKDLIQTIYRILQVSIVYNFPEGSLSSFHQRATP